MALSAATATSRRFCRVPRILGGVALIADPVTKAYGTAAGAFVRQYCLEHNLLIGVGGNFGSVLRIQPPLVISDAQLDTVFGTVADGIAAARAAGTGSA